MPRMVDDTYKSAAILKLLMPPICPLHAIATQSLGEKDGVRGGEIPEPVRNRFLISFIGIRLLWGARYLDISRGFANGKNGPAF